MNNPKPDAAEVVPIEIHSGEMLGDACVASFVWPFGKSLSVPNTDYAIVRRAAMPSVTIDEAVKLLYPIISKHHCSGVCACTGLCHTRKAKAVLNALHDAGVLNVREG